MQNNLHTYSLVNLFIFETQSARMSFLLEKKHAKNRLPAMLFDSPSAFSDFGSKTKIHQLYINNNGKLIPQSFFDGS